jgi:Ala-tRNA(Pro) deacylase
VRWRRQWSFWDGGYAIAVLPANTHIDLPLLADSIGLTELRLATEEELLALFPDVELGAMPPFGNLYGMPVYLDERLVDEPMIAFNAGTHTDTVHMRTREFMRLTDALVLPFARKC